MATKRLTKIEKNGFADGVTAKGRKGSGAVVEVKKTPRTSGAKMMRKETPLSKANSGIKSAVSKAASGVKRTFVADTIDKIKRKNKN